VPAARGVVVAVAVLVEVVAARAVAVDAVVERVRRAGERGGLGVVAVAAGERAAVDDVLRRPVGRVVGVEAVAVLVEVVVAGAVFVDAVVPGVGDAGVHGRDGVVA